MRKKQTQKIDVGEIVQRNYSWIKKKIARAHNVNVRTFYGAFLVYFFVGIAASLILTARHDFVITSQAGSIQSANPELEQIKQKIKEKKAKWVAGDTSVSGLSLADKKKLVIEKLEAPTDAQPGTTSTTPLPATLDWRNNNGNFVTPVKNQAMCGSCWAFALTAAAESAMLIADQTPYSQNLLDLSEQVLVSCGSSNGCNGGSTLSGSEFIKNSGLPLESCYPYTATNGSCSSACANWQSTPYKISKYVNVVTDRNPDVIKNALANYGPVVTTMYVYNDFYYYKSGVYSYTGGTQMGRHAVVIVGYDDVNQYFILKNSWGTGWGENGYFRVAYSAMSAMADYQVAFGGYIIYDQAPVTPIAPENIPPSVSINSPANNSTVSGTTTISISASDNIGVTKVEYYLDNVLKDAGTSSPYNFNWDTTVVANDSHSIMAKAYDAAGNFGSASVAVTVSNNAPGPDITPPDISLISPTNGSTVSGTTTISISASDNVGVSKVDYWVDYVLKSTSTSSYNFNWDTTTVTNGSHNLMVKAYDARENVGATSVTVTVSNNAPPPGPISPIVTIKTPANGSTYTKSMKISATASDNTGIKNMLALIDNTPVCSSRAATLSCSVNVSKLSTKGNHTITVRATNTAGNVGSTSAAVTFK